MNLVFVLQHVRIYENGEEDRKVIGVYRSEAAGHAAIERLKFLPEFLGHSRLVDPINDEDETGFHLGSCELDTDGWEEGFVTMMPNGQECESDV